MDEDYTWIPVVAGVGFAIWILSIIPVWVYVTLGCLVATGFVIWLLGICGVYDAIGSWWGRKSADGRVRFRKGCWCVVVGTTIALLCLFFPIEAGIPVAVFIALAFAARWLVRCRARRRVTAICAMDAQATA